MDRAILLGPRGRQELRSFEDVKKHFDELARLTGGKVDTTLTN